MVVQKISEIKENCTLIAYSNLFLRKKFRDSGKRFKGRGLEKVYESISGL